MTLIMKVTSSLTDSMKVCKYFLDAIDNEKYGWFWECPNGGKDCKYKHALPPGFVLKKKGEKTEAVKEISIEGLVEVEVRKIACSLFWCFLITIGREPS
jgi:hypothetical protein